MSLVLFIVGAILLVIVALLPVKIAAGLVGARNDSFGACLIAVIVAVVINTLAARLFHYGGFVSALLTGVAYMLVLETTYLKGVLIALLQVVIAWLFGLLLMALGLVQLVHMMGPGTAHGAGWV
jgi:hypothetical protein